MCVGAFVRKLNDGEYNYPLPTGSAQKVLQKYGDKTGMYLHMHIQ